MRFRGVSERESNTVRKLALVPFLGGQNRKSRSLVFLSSKTKRKRLLRSLATHGSDKSPRVYWRISDLIFRHVAIIITKFCCGDKDFVGRGEIRTLLKNACVGGYVLRIPLELIGSNRDFVIEAREAHLIDKAMYMTLGQVKKKNRSSWKKQMFLVPAHFIFWGRLSYCLLLVTFVRTKTNRQEDCNPFDFSAVYATKGDTSQRGKSRKLSGRLNHSPIDVFNSPFCNIWYDALRCCLNHVPK